MLVQTSTSGFAAAMPSLLAISHATIPKTAATTTTSLAMAQPMIDMTRVMTRLDGLQSYGVIAALLMNSSLRLYAATPKRAERDKPFENAVKFLFTMSMMFSVISGSYTTVVFSLLGLYSKHALGSGMDREFLEFFEATKDIRVSGFDSFIVCLASFKFSFCLSLFLNYKAKIRWLILAMAGILSWMAWQRWSVILSLAGSLLFPGEQ